MPDTGGMSKQPAGGGTGLCTVAHIFVDSKGDYYEIVDELPRFGESRHTTPENLRDR